jgi:hypothetical protein
LIVLHSSLLPTPRCTIGRVKRLLTRRRVLLVLLLLAFVGGGAWCYFSPRLTDEEKPFVGRWTWAVSYPNPPYAKPPHPPGSVQVFELLSDRSARHAIFLPDGTQAGKSFAAKWRVENGELILDHWFPGNIGFAALWRSAPNGMAWRFPVVTVNPDRLDLRPEAQVRKIFGEGAIHIWTHNDAAPAPSGPVMTGKDLGF